MKKILSFLVAFIFILTVAPHSAFSCGVDFCAGGYVPIDFSGLNLTFNTTLTANPTTINEGDRSLLTWTSGIGAYYPDGSFAGDPTPYSYCNGNFNMGDAYYDSVTGTSHGGPYFGSAYVTPSATKTYGVNCTVNGVPAPSASTTVIVLPPGGVTVTVTANPSSIQSGNSSTISWTSTHATSCTSTQFSTGGATSGTAIVSPTVDTTYTVTCIGSGTGNVWRYYGSDTTDLQGPTCNINNAYPTLSNCPASPQGTACTTQGTSCKVNTYAGQACNVNTDIYNCVSAGGATASAKVTVIPGTLSASCTVTPMWGYKNSTIFTFVATAAGGGTAGTAGSAGSQKLVEHQTNEMKCSGAVVGTAEYGALMDGGDKTNYTAEGLPEAPSDIMTNPGKYCWEVDTAAHPNCDLMPSWGPYGCGWDWSYTYTWHSPATMTGATKSCVDSGPSVTTNGDPNLYSNCSPKASTFSVETTSGTNATQSVPPAYSYLWTGTDGLSGNTNVTTKTYSSSGTKQGTVTVTDTTSGTSASSASLATYPLFQSACTGTSISNNVELVDAGCSGPVFADIGASPLPLPSGFDAHPENYCLEFRVSNYAANQCRMTYQWFSGSGVTSQPDVGTNNTVGYQSYGSETFALQPGGGGGGGSASGICAATVFDCANGSCALPDLIASTTNMTPSAPKAGDTVTLTSSVKNIGGATATNFPNVFQVADESKNVTVQMVAANTVASLATTSAGTALTATAQLPGGDYNVRACANSDVAWGGSIPESDNTNNCGPWLAISVIGRADLEAYPPVSYPSNPTPTDTIHFNTSILNAGTLAVASGTTIPVRYQVVSDPSGNPDPDYNSATNLDQPSGLTTGLAMNAVKTAANSPNWTAPSAGLYAVRACANVPGFPVDESNTGNNCGASTLVTVCPSGKVWDGSQCVLSTFDLKPTGLVPNGTTAGHYTVFTATVANVGTNVTPSFASELYVCAQSDADCQSHPTASSWWQRIFGALIKTASADTSLKIPMSVLSVAGLGSGTQSGGHTFDTPGNFTMQFCADTPVNAVPETNESDNCGSWTLLVVCDADQIWDGSQCVGAPVQANLYAVSPIVIGDSSYLTWTSTNATHCTSSDFSTGASHPPQSSDPGVKVTPSASRDYTIQCTNDSGQSGTSSAHVEVKNPEVFINANPPLVRIGTPSTISWGTTLGHVTSCSVTGPGLNSTAISNAGTPVVINAESTFVINCHAGAFYPSDSATVKVAPSFIEF